MTTVILGLRSAITVWAAGALLALSQPAATAAPVNVARAAGTVASGSSSAADLARFADGIYTNDAYFQTIGPLFCADRLYDMTSFSYVDNTDNRIGDFALRYGSQNTGTVTDTSVGSGTAPVPMSGTLAGRAGMALWSRGAHTPVSQTNGGGAELEIWGEPTAILRLPTPTVIASAIPFSGSYVVANAFDRNVNTEYASQGQGANTYIDFDMGGPTSVGYVEILQRANDLVNQFALIFSDDTTFGDAGDVTVSYTSGGNQLDLVDLAAGGYTGTKRYMRYDVITTLSGGNQGAQEIAFYVPEPGALGLLFGAGVWLLRRRAAAGAVIK